MTEPTITDNCLETSHRDQKETEQNMSTLTTVQPDWYTAASVLSYLQTKQLFYS